MSSLLFLEYSRSFMIVPFDPETSPPPSPLPLPHPLLIPLSCFMIPQNTYYQLTHYIFHLLTLSTAFLPQLGHRFLIFFSLMYPWCVGEFPTHSRYSIHICWISEWVNKLASNPGSGKRTEKTHSDSYLHECLRRQTFMYPLMQIIMHLERHQIVRESRFLYPVCMPMRVCTYFHIC